jgi:hypothetical protein
MERGLMGDIFGLYYDPKNMILDYQGRERKNALEQLDAYAKINQGENQNIPTNIVESLQKTGVLPQGQQQQVGILDKLSGLFGGGQNRQPQQQIDATAPTARPTGQAQNQTQVPVGRAGIQQQQQSGGGLASTLMNPAQQQPQRKQYPMPKQNIYTLDPMGKIDQAGAVPLGATVHNLPAAAGAVGDRKTYVSPDGSKTVEGGFTQAGKFVGVDPATGRTIDRVPEGYTTSGVYEAGENRKTREADRQADRELKKTIFETTQANRMEGGKPSADDTRILNALRNDLGGREPTDKEFLEAKFNYLSGKAGAQERGRRKERLVLSDSDKILAQKLADNEISPSQLSRRTDNYNSVLAQAFRLNPDFDAKLSDAEKQLLGNQAFRTRGMNLEVLPGMLKSVADAGKALKYNDVQFLGKLDKWQKGQLNDPAFVNYMTQRNDIILRLASVMRGASATDQSQRLEEEAFKPTLSPQALDGWLQAQLSVATPLIEQYEQATGGRDRRTSIKERASKRKSQPDLEPTDTGEAYLKSIGY